MSYFKNKGFWFWGFIVLLIFNISIFGTMAYHVYSMHNTTADNEMYIHGRKKNIHNKHQKGQSSLMNELNLTVEQRKQLKKARKKHMIKMKALKKELFVAQHRLFEVAGKEKVDSTEIQKYRSQMMEIQGRIADESLQFLGEMKVYLTPEQQELMKKHFRNKYNN